MERERGIARLEQGEGILIKPYYLLFDQICQEMEGHAKHINGMDFHPQNEALLASVGGKPVCHLGHEFRPGCEVC